MSLKTLVGLGALGTAAWLLYRNSATYLANGSLFAPVALPWGSLDPFGTGASADQPDAPADSSYGADVTAAESGGNPLAKSGTSSASGIYGFTKATWQSVGGAWGSDPTKAFGGLTPSVSEQTARFNQLTQRNSSGLVANGISATNGALYAAHFLGLGTALKVLTAPASAALGPLVGSAVLAANPFLQGWTVSDFLSWAETKG